MQDGQQYYLFSGPAKISQTRGHKTTQPKGGDQKPDSGTPLFVRVLELYIVYRRVTSALHTFLHSFIDVFFHHSRYGAYTREWREAHHPDRCQERFKHQDYPPVVCEMHSKPILSINRVVGCSPWNKPVSRRFLNRCFGLTSQLFRKRKKKRRFFVAHPRLLKPPRLTYVHNVVLSTRHQLLPFTV